MENLSDRAKEYCNEGSSRYLAFSVIKKRIELVFSRNTYDDCLKQLEDYVEYGELIIFDTETGKVMLFHLAK